MKSRSLVLTPINIQKIQDYEFRQKLKFQLKIDILKKHESI